MHLSSESPARNSDCTAQMCITDVYTVTVRCFPTHLPAGYADAGGTTNPANPEKAGPGAGRGKAYKCKKHTARVPHTETRHF